MTENKGITDSRIGYEAKGSITSSPAVAVTAYVFAGVLIIAGIIVYFAVIPEPLVIAAFVFLAALSVLMGLAAAKHAWYWDDEKFSVLQLFSKPKTYKFSEIASVYTVTEGPAVTLILRMQDGKEFGISLRAKGTREFVEQLDSIQRKNAEA